jgi:predicted DCC family thiol-disulfide oxidoreductase YuxK
MFRSTRRCDSAFALESFACRVAVVSKPALTIWHNSICPVCEAGISRQKERVRAAVAAGEIEFRDINLEPEALKDYGASVDDVRRRLHAVDKDGALLVGAGCRRRGLARYTRRSLAGDSVRRARGHLAHSAFLRSIRRSALGMEQARGKMVTNGRLAVDSRSKRRVIVLYPFVLLAETSAELSESLLSKTFAADRFVTIP